MSRTSAQWTQKPKLPPNGWKLIDLFPCITFNLRTPVLRIDSYSPLAPDRVILDIRILGLKSDSAENRRQREKDAALIWSRFGRNLHETGGRVGCGVIE